MGLLVEGHAQVMALLSPKVWIALALAAVLAFTHAFTYRAGKATVRTEFEAYKREVSDAQRKQTELARQEDARRQAGVDAVAAQAREENTRLQADVVRLAGAADGLQRDLADFKRRASARACPADRGKSQPGADPLDVLAQLFTRSGQVAGELAVYADALRTAGAACERSVDQMSR